MAQSQRIPTLLAETRRGPPGNLVRLLRRLELECRSREDADEVADSLAVLLPDPVAGRLGLIELLLNAIEHGNLEIGSAQKGELILEHRLGDELTARLARDPYRARRVRVIVSITFPLVEIEIHDEGSGFPWRQALVAELDASDRPCGRGIAIVRRACFPGLEYRDPGNVAIVRVLWPR